MTLEDRILFIDGEVIVLDKPAGLPVDAPRRGGDSIERRLPELLCGYKQLPTPMHRLDQDTSGCLLFARHKPARRWFQQEIEAGRMEKRYLAVVGGEVEEEGGTIDMPLGKISSEDAGWRMTYDQQGKEALTHWRRLEVKDGKSLIEFSPKTGRTHQIRVHAREGLGHGIVGDRVYGFPGGPMLLHAQAIAIPRKNGATLEVSAPLPEHFEGWSDVA